MTTRRNRRELRLAISEPAALAALDRVLSENERLRCEVGELQNAMAQERADHRIEQDGLDQQCKVLARQNDRLIKQRDDAIAQAGSAIG